MFTIFTLDLLDLTKKFLCSI